MCWWPGVPNPLTVVPRFRQHYSRISSYSASRGRCWNRDRVYDRLTFWNGRRISIIRQLSINNSVQFWGIPDFVGGSGLLFLPNLQDPADPKGWVNGGTYNQNWRRIKFGPYSINSVTWGASVYPCPAYLRRITINPRAAVCRVCNNLLCCRRQERLRSLSNRRNPIVNPRVHCWDDSMEDLVTQYFNFFSVDSVRNLSLPITSVSNCLWIACRITFTSFVVAEFDT